MKRFRQRFPQFLKLGNNELYEITCMKFMNVSQEEPITVANYRKMNLKFVNLIYKKTDLCKCLFVLEFLLFMHPCILTDELY